MQRTLVVKYRRPFLREEEEILIELVAQNPVLYDTVHPGYKDKEFRDAVWQFIGQSLNKDGKQYIQNYF